MIADNTDCTVATVFAGIPPFDQLTPYDEQSSFASSREAMIARRSEDVRAMRVLGADYIHLDHLDSQYRGLRPRQVRESLERLISGFFPEGERRRVIGPLGQRHPDHECVSNALMGIRKDVEMDLFLYEEIPYRVLWPEEAHDALKRLPMNLSVSSVEPVNLGVGSKDLKREAVGCYVSQKWSTDLNCVFVPERFWRVR